MGQLPNMQGVFYFLCAVSAVVGWASIEFVLWLLSHVSITLA
jgi:hypothetical protein